MNDIVDLPAHKDYSTLVVNYIDGVVTVQLNRPDKLNANQYGDGQPAARGGRHLGRAQPLTAIEKKYEEWRQHYHIYCREPMWEPSGRTTSHDRRTGTDRRRAIMPARRPIWTTLNGIQVSTDQMLPEASARPKLRARSASQRRELTVTAGQPDTPAHLRTGRPTSCANRPSKLGFTPRQPSSNESSNAIGWRWILTHRGEREDPGRAEGPDEFGRLSVCVRPPL